MSTEEKHLASAKTSNDTALEHFDFLCELREVPESDPLQLQGTVEDWSHRTGLHAAAVADGFVSGLAYLTEHRLWDTPMCDIFEGLDPTKRPTFTYETPVTKLTTADLETEIGRKTKCTGHFQMMRLGAALRHIRRTLDERGDHLVLLDGTIQSVEVNGCIEYPVDISNEVRPLHEWFEYDNDHIYIY